MKSSHPLYRVWIDTKKRCRVVRGISEKRGRIYKDVHLCQEWYKFEPFYEWAKDKWATGLYIDRKNTLDGYSPSNCRFVTCKINNQNSKLGKTWFINGIIFKSSRDAASFFGCSQTHIYIMCHGKRYKSGRFLPPAVGCYAIKKYPEA